MAASLSIRAVAERTGLSPHVIRAWERRYRAIAPERSAGQHRLYSEEEVERLGLLNRAVQLGHSIGKVAALTTDELRAMVARALSAAGPPRNPRGDRRAGHPNEEVMAAVQSFAEATLRALLHQQLLSLGAQGLVMRFIAPLAQEIGERWRAGELTAAHEHFFTAGVIAFLGSLRRPGSTPDHAPCLIVSTPAGQHHELGAAMAATVASNLGWKSIYLGPNLPAHEIAGAAQRNEAAAVALSIVYPEDDPSLAHELLELARLLLPRTRLVVGGRAAEGYTHTLSQIGALRAQNLEEFSDVLDALRRS